MVMGTGSSVGKSLLATAICRCFARRGIRVAPFKSQNMSNNAAVCEGGEIGRAQALQAAAAGVKPSTDMNPILLKPEGDIKSQVVVNGRPLHTLEAADYFTRRKQLWPHVTAALDRLRQSYDVVVIEGAGSPVELNLTDVEMVNMSVARYCQAAVLLVGDIERGGVFAQLLGTLSLLPTVDQRLIRGLIVNKFRGDLSLFDSGIEILQQRGGVPVLGVLPWIELLNLPEEDAAELTSSNTNRRIDQLDIAVIRLPHISNFDDFDPLKAESHVALRYVDSVAQLDQPDVVILPGTKNTIDDIDWLRESGLANRIRELAKSSDSNVTIVGVCGGYQMLGRVISNPYQLESDKVESQGLDLLDVDTTFQQQKRASQIKFQIIDDSLSPGVGDEIFDGYEIHSGQSKTRSAWIRRVENCSDSTLSPLDGAMSHDKRIWGCYIHGLFHNDSFRRAWLQNLGVEPDMAESVAVKLNAAIDRLADAFETNVDFETIMEFAESTVPSHYKCRP